MLYRLNAAINRLDGVLITHSTELDACTGPVPRAVVDDLIRAANAVIDAARWEPPAIDEPTLPLTVPQRVADNAVAEMLALADSWHDDEPEHSPLREWQADVEDVTA